MSKPPLPKRPKSMTSQQIYTKIDCKNTAPRSALDNYENFKKPNANQY